MKARAYILTLGTSLALLAPATQAASGGSEFGCRVLQADVTCDDDEMVTFQPLWPICGEKTLRSCVPPRYYQVLKNTY